MATKDGKTFGKHEYEALYDFMMDHKHYGFEQLVLYCINVLDMAGDEAADAVVAMRKERRQAIMGNQPIVYFVNNLIDKAGDLIPRSGIIQIVKSGWNLDRESAADLVDSAIFNLPDARKKLVVYDNVDELIASVEKHVGRVEEERVPLEPQAVTLTGDPKADHAALKRAFMATGYGDQRERCKEMTDALDRVAGHYPEVAASVDLEDFSVGTMVNKYKGYRFPGEVVSRFTTRKGKVRYVVEGIADGNDECLHIFSASDLQTLTVEHGWIYSADGYWWWSEDYPTGGRMGLRPATAAEQQFIRAIATGTPKPFGAG